jgi:hypothetical protein
MKEKAIAVRQLIDDFADIRASQPPLINSFMWPFCLNSQNSHSRSSEALQIPGKER